MLYVSTIWQACNAEEAEHHSALARLLQALAALVHAARAAADLQEAMVGVAISFMTLLSGSDLLAKICAPVQRRGRCWPTCSGHALGQWDTDVRGQQRRRRGRSAQRMRERPALDHWSALHLGDL